MLLIPHGRCRLKVYLLIRLQNDEGASFAEQKTLTQSIQDAELTLDIYFYVVSGLCCILLFFASWTSIQ